MTADMAVDVPRLMSLRPRTTLRWGVRDVHLYAHGIGLGLDPLDPAELAYFRDEQPGVFPTFLVARTLGNGPLASAGLDMRGVLHGEHSLTLHNPVPAEGTVVMEGAMSGVWDKGPEKGAVLIEEKRLTDERSGEPLATVRATVFARNDGGIGSTGGAQPEPHILPDRAPDAEVEITTAPNQALLYRLSGDRNPIHSDPAAAAAAHFERPILHGLCTYAMCARAVVDRFAGRASDRLRHIQARFSAPVYPGDRLRIRLWRDGERISFEAHVPERGVSVIKAGKAIVAETVA